MSRSRSPNRELAKELWLQSGKKRMLKDIAEEIGVSETLVRKWKSQDAWEKVTLPFEPKPKSNVTKKRGAPFGNKNAVGSPGGHPPSRNTNAVKHGAYMQVFDDLLDDTERKVLETVQGASREEMLWEQVGLLTIRERRLLLQIEKFKELKGDMLILSASRKNWHELGSKGETLPEGTTTENTIMQNTADIIRKYESELTRVQTQKSRIIKQLSEIETIKLDNQERMLRIEKIKLEIGGIVPETNEEDPQSSVTQKIEIYIPDNGRN